MLAVLVFFAHWNGLTQQGMTNVLFHLSRYAVDMFFIVSGFLIFWSFDNDQRVKNFFIKRFFRIFPLYAILIFFQTIFLISFSDGSLYETLRYFVANLLFLNFLSPTVGSIFSDLQVNAINGSLWTLKNEVVFYLLLPLIFRFYQKWGLGFLSLLYAASVMYMIAVDYIGVEKLLVQFPAQLRLFLTGIFFYLLIRKIDTRHSMWLALVALCLVVLLSDNRLFRFALYPATLGFLVVWIVFFVKSVKIPFDFSYSFYILHFPVIQIVLYFQLNPENPVGSFILLFATVLLLSYLSEKYIEKRFIGMGKDLIEVYKKHAN